MPQPTTQNSPRLRVNNKRTCSTFCLPSLASALNKPSPTPRTASWGASPATVQPTQFGVGPCGAAHSTCIVLPAAHLGGTDALECNTIQTTGHSSGRRTIHSGG